MRSRIDGSHKRLDRLRAFRVVMIATATMLLAGAGSADGASGGEHCVTHLVPVSSPQAGIVNAILVDGGCYPTFAAAIEAGTSGALLPPDTVAPGDLDQSNLDTSLVAASDVLLGTEWEGTNFTGASQSYFASTGCASTTWQVSNVGPTWNDRFESGKGFGTCDHNRKFEHENFGGAVVLCTPNCGTYGGLRNDVTSLRWAD
jgi:hypothetical protein